MDEEDIDDLVDGGGEDMADDWAAAMEEQAAEEELDIEPQPLDELIDEGGAIAVTDNPDLEVILDIPVNISMVVGATQISIRNLLQLNQGSVIELDRLAGEPLDVMVNDTLIAHGEVVVVNEKFGIRLTDVVSAAERIRKARLMATEQVFQVALYLGLIIGFDFAAWVRRTENCAAECSLGSRWYDGGQQLVPWYERKASHDSGGRQTNADRRDAE